MKRLSWSCVISGVICLLADVSRAMATTPLPQSTASEYQRFERWSRMLEKPGAESALARREINEAYPGVWKRVKEGVELSLGRWEYSWNFDQIAKQKVLEQSVLQALGIPFKTDNGKITVSAGVMHSYGYLFSTLDTPFGRKSKRWLEGNLPKRLSLEDTQSFSIGPKTGEFVSNLTRFLDEKVSLSPCLVETVALQKSGRVIDRWKVWTCFTPLGPNPAMDDPEVQLLFYGVQRNLESSQLRWVTAFPVRQEKMNEILGKRTNVSGVFEPQYNWNPFGLSERCDQLLSEGAITRSGVTLIGE